MLLGARQFFERRGAAKDPYAGINAFELTVAEGGYDFSFTPYNDRYIGQTKGVRLASGHSSFVVDWGDGSAKETLGAADIAGMHHVYSSAGTYVLTVSDDVEMLMFQNSNELTAILGLGTLNTCSPIDWSGMEFGYRNLFANCPNLKTVNMFYSGITAVDRILYNDTGLEGVVLPEGALSMGNGIFGKSFYTNQYVINNITCDVVVPARVTSISNIGNVQADNVFRSIPNASSVRFPAGLTEIKGNYLFYTMRYDLYFNSPTPPTLLSANTLYYYQGSHIYVPAASVDAYKTAQYWSSMASRIFAIEDNLP